MKMKHIVWPPAVKTAERLTSRIKDREVKEQCRECIAQFLEADTPLEAELAALRLPVHLSTLAQDAQCILRSALHAAAAALRTNQEASVEYK